MRIAFIASFLTVALAATAWATTPASPAAAEGARPGNAAVVYWQAFAALPALTPEEQQWLAAAAKAPAGPMPPKVKILAKQQGPALELMHRATLAKACDWELDYSEGPMLPLPHLAKLRELARGAQLRAGLRLASGDVPGAVDDLTAILKMARDAAVSPLLISVLVGASIETPAEDLLAANLPRLDRPRLDRLQQQLTALPATPSVADCLRTEQQMSCGWLERQFAAELALPDNTNIRDQAAAQLKRLGLLENLSGEQSQRAADAIGTVASLRASLVRLRQAYAAAAQIATLKSAGERRERLKKFDEDFGKTAVDQNGSEDWLASQLLPAMGKVMERETKRDVRRELLRLAIQVQREGQASIAAAGIRGSSLKYEATSSGFELRYRETSADAWEVLRVGTSEE